MGLVDPAEQEASEVLHSLLSVERVEKQEEDCMDDPDDVKVYSASHSVLSSVQNVDAEIIQWNTPVTMSTHGLFSNLEPSVDEQVVVWDNEVDRTVDMGETICQDDELPIVEHVQETEEEGIEEDGDEDDVFLDQRPRLSEARRLKSNAASPKRLLKKNQKRQRPIEREDAANMQNNRRRVGPAEHSTNIEESAAQVKDRFKRGCECMDESCFRGLNPENVYKHRLNIAELTKGEHDMYLMGVTMACLSNPDTTVRQKERRRLRAQYVYQGRRVCLDAFLYLENCTHYQLKRIRKHVMTHGVAPRVHGNHGKKPHNTFSLDIYKHATEFLKQYLEQHMGEPVGGPGTAGKHPCVQLPWDITRKSLHDSYREYGQILEPGIKLMGYSTFRHFMKFQFPHVKFCKMDGAKAKGAHEQEIEHEDNGGQHCLHVTNDGAVQQMIPLVTVTGGGDGTATGVVTQVQSPQTYIVTNVPTQGTVASGTISYQLNAGYTINEEGNIISTVSNTFNRI